MRSLLLPLAASAMFLMTACGEDAGAGAGAIVEADASTPEGALVASVAALSTNDFTSLMKITQTPEQHAEMVAQFDAERAESSPEQLAEMNGTIQMLTAEGAEDLIYTMIQPKLAEAQGMLAMAPMMLGMAMAQLGQDPAADPAEQEQQQALMMAVQGWAAQVNLADEEKAKQAIGIICDAARSTGVTAAEQMQEMPFDELLGKAGMMVQGLKDVAALYGLDLQATIDSISVGEAAIDGDEATVPVTLSFLGVEMSDEVNMIKQGDNWYPKPMEDESEGQVIETYPVEAGEPVEGEAESVP